MYEFIQSVARRRGQGNILVRHGRATVWIPCDISDDANVWRIELAATCLNIRSMRPVIPKIINP